MRIHRRRVIVAITTVFMASARAFADAPGQCQASDPASLQSCVTQVYQGAASTIVVTGMISCSGKNACAVNLSNLSQPVQIMGQTGVQAGFNRYNHYNYPVINLSNDGQVTLTNLVFNEIRPNQEDLVTHQNDVCYPNCQAPINIENSSNIDINGVTVNNSKAHGIEVDQVNNFSVENSIIENSFFGIWYGSGVSNVKIEDNYFYANRSNAMYYEATAANPNAPSLIEGNTFDHNHHDAAFFTCGIDKKSACSGGQLLLITSETTNLLVQDNEIENGYMEDNDQKVFGVELDGPFSNILIQGNSIHDNTGPGFDGSDASGVSISSNVVFNNYPPPGNGPAQIMAPHAALSGNCYTSGCLPIQIPTPP